MSLATVLFNFFSSLGVSPQNLIAQSQSGTGKTAAFVLAMLSRVEPENRYPQVTGLGAQTHA